MKPWFFYFLKKSISQRKGRFLIASSAVALTVAVVSALAMLSLGVRDKIGAELKQYGANMIVTGRSGGEIDAETAAAIRGMGAAIKDSAVQVYGAMTVKGMVVEVMGMEPGKMSGFRLHGVLPKAPGEMMVGINLRDLLKVKQGDALAVPGNGSYRVAAVFEKGPDEDSMLVMSLEDAQRALGITGVSAVLLNADTKRLNEVEEWVRQRHPSLQVKTLKQVAVAEERILGRVQLLMLLVTAVVLFSSVIALGSTMGANVIERMEEIGLMKSLGATRKDIRNFFMAEAGAAGLGGALAGYLAGVIAAEAVSRTAFGSFVPVNLPVMPGAMLLGVVIAVVSTYLPVRNAMKVVPAQILRGE
jgi:putative ABC transport system permease protein